MALALQESTCADGTGAREEAGAAFTKRVGMAVVTWSLGYEWKARNGFQQLEQHAEQDVEGPVEAELAERSFHDGKMDALRIGDK
jgi:hypothetical protein